MHPCGAFFVCYELVVGNENAEAGLTSSERRARERRLRKR